MFWKLSLVFLVTLLTKGCESQPFACGSAPLNTKIVGGENATAGSWPWQVSLHTDGSHFCGGSVINNQWVLTAAHCMPGLVPSNITVYMGILSQDLPNPNGVSFSVSLIITHQQYNPSTMDNDIALLQLSSPVTFNNYIQPVCLAGDGSTFNSDIMWVTGWGTIQSGVPLPAPQVLQEVAVPLVGNSQCYCDYNGAITGDMMCAGVPEGGKDSCQGDSGGPMVIKQGAQWIQAGIVSFGQGCGLPNIPGVYTRVSQYEMWITSTVLFNPVGFVNYTSTTPAQNGNVNCTAQPTVCGGFAGSYPWMASINYNSYPVCEGTLIADQFVMTSASCISNFPGATQNGWSVVLDVVQPDCSSLAVSSNVTNIITDDVLGNSVALLQLSYPFSSVANLPVDTFDVNFGPGTPCTVIGWNPVGTSYPPFEDLQTTIVNCNPSDSSQLNICTELLNLQQNADGAPLLCKIGSMWVQTGIFSFSNAMLSQNSNSTVFMKTSPFGFFLAKTVNNYPSVLDGAKPLSALSLGSIFLLSLPAILQTFN